MFNRVKIEITLDTDKALTKAAQDQLTGHLLAQLELLNDEHGTDYEDANAVIHQARIPAGEIHHDGVKVKGQEILNHARECWPHPMLTLALATIRSTPLEVPQINGTPEEWNAL